MSSAATRFRAAGLLPAALFTLLALVGDRPAAAQAGFTEELEATRTEAWAMRWFAAVATPTMFGVAGETEPWSFELALEGGSIPSLSEDERRVGFNGTKVEDLNRAPLFGRPVVRLGLPADFTLSAGWVPPIDFDGVTPNLLSLALARPLWTGERGRLGAQVFYLDGKIEGDITCPQDEVDAGDDPVGNPFGCEEASDDTMSISSWGVELGYAWQATPTVELFVSGIWQQLDAEFQVRALYSGFEDRNKLVYDGDDIAWTAGLGWQATAKLHLAGELFYSPLDVIRDPTGRGPSENDALFNFRLLGTYKLH
ncbi:MAG: hypothetical protein QG573_6 [Acidobacteriota bacterium]|nr:hypothetical protein [Acidobacteriota bacterium]